MTLDSGRFREVMGLFATGVTVLTIPPAEDPHGITVNSFTSVSLDPPLVLVCLDHDSTAHERLSGQEGYCVNVLATDQRHLGEYFAGMTDGETSPFEVEPTHTAVTGAPVFSESLGYLDCTVESAVAAGDHTIYIGRVRAAESLRRGDPARPLTYFTGNWGTVDSTAPRQSD